jgi:glycosyltransferase involved in cell wall biosynthesis
MSNFLAFDHDSLPKLLLVTEACLCNNGTGVNRTLFNLLDQYPTDRLMLLCAGDGQSVHMDTSPPFDNNVTTYKNKYLPTLLNRFGIIINPIMEVLNLQLLDWLPLSNYQKIVEFSPELILICPNSSSALTIGHKITQQLNCPSLVYFMDDWIASNQEAWLSGGVQPYTQNLLREATGWLMISKQLERELIDRYHISPQRSLIVHNPVDILTLEAPDFSTHQDTFKVVYAGSIWPMHYDSVAAIAEAIFQLRQEGHDIELILHVPQMFWTQYQQYWYSWQVIYGSMIAYENLQIYLRRADLLLVASSFLPEHTHITRSSVQTKLTDYMVSGRPILSCGPVYSACNDFVREWNCGLICSDSDVSVIKLMLKEAIANRDENQSFAQTAFDVVSEMFDKPIVIQHLFNFIGKSIPSGSPAQIPVQSENTREL